MTTPAASAEVCSTPNSMQTENSTLPNRLCRNSSRRSLRVVGASQGSRRSQCSIAGAAIAKRSQASRKTGNTASSSLDSPT